MKRLTLFCLLLSLGLGACLPIPQRRLDLQLPPATYRFSPLTVQTEYVTVPGAQEPHTPAEYNQSYYLRYFRAEDTPETVLILVPGILGGATSFETVARQLVAGTEGLEVWAVDRRANALEDRSGMVESLKQSDPTRAYEYYVENEGTPEGFNVLEPADISFVAHWGLEVHLRDLHETVLRARQHADAVVLGGHSLGASQVGFYTSFDFGEAEVSPGYAFIDGLVLLDGVLGRTGGLELDLSLPTNLGIVPTVKKLEAGEATPYFAFGLGPTFQAEREVLALLVRFRPDELAPEEFIPFPATNRAALGILGDDRYSVPTVFGSSLGEAVGGEIGGNLGAFLLGGTVGATSQSVSGVAEGYEYVDWQRGDPAVERSDIDELVRGWATRETNRNEWYFPVRLALEIAQADIRLENAPGYVPTVQVTTPTLAVGARRGLVARVDGFEAYSNARPGSPFSSYILPGLTHLDITQAEENPLVPLFKLWLNGIK